MKNKQKDNERLRKLLKSPKEEIGDADSFEAFAREGFELLKDDTEAFELKQSLDTAIAEKLSHSKDATVKKKYYWAAAAAVLFMTGGAIYVYETYLPDEALPEIALHTEIKKDTKLSEHSALSDKGTPVTESLIESPVPASASIKHVIQEKSKEPETSKPVPQVAAGETKALKEDMVAVSPDENKMAYTPEATVQTEQMATVETERSVYSNNGENAAPLSSTSENQVMLKQESIKSSKKKKPSEYLSCSYEGGDKVLREAVFKRLENKGLLQPFDVRLFISNKGKVSKVEFTSTTHLDKKTKSLIENELLQLDKFVVDITAGSKAVFIYLLDFRP